MKFSFEFSYSIDIENCQLNTLIRSFNEIRQVFMNAFIQKVLTEFADYYMSLETKPFCCDRCLNNTQFIWKTQHGKITKIMTIIQAVFLNQLQVQCKCCGHKFFITRFLLGLEKRTRILPDTIKKLGLIGALTTFRVSEKILSLFGIALDKMTIWRSVQKTAKDIEFNIDPKEEAVGEADGTGIPIVGIKQRGQEMKVFVQRKKNGGVRVAGLSIDKYDQGWDKLFKPLIPNLKKFKKFLLITDGDDSILKSIKDIVQIKFQRCLWHIPHQLKYVLWKDNAKRKSNEWMYVLGEILSICSIKSIQDENRKDIIDRMLTSKEKQLNALIGYCEDEGWKNCAIYLQNARWDMFTCIRNRLNGKTTSHAERVMKTINYRINVGKWGPEGALNVNKIRLAYYYNGFDVV
jgi:hypothetical protein